MSNLTGRCFCRAVRWEASGPMLWTSLCHCEDCRRAASSDYVSWFGVNRDTVTWQGPRKCYQSSKGVVRSFCGDCGSPLSFETEVFPDETHLYAVTLDDPGAYTPKAHIYWSEHLPWVHVSDDLPKHNKGSQHAAKAGKKLLD